MKIIMLTGAPDSGKSTTLKHLYEDFILKDGVSRQIMRENYEDSIDFFATFQRNDLKVGISSSGDELQYIYANHKRALDDGCGLYICANSHKLYAYRILEEDESGFALTKGPCDDIDEKRIIDVIMNIINHVQVLG